MKLLDDIVDGAIDDQVSVASLLLKTMVIADRLGNAT